MTRSTATLLLLLALSAGTARAQSEYWNLAPLRFALEFESTDTDHHDVRIAADRSVPLEFFLPNVSPGSRVDVMGAAVGARFVDGRATFRWRVVPLDVDLTRPPWTGGVTLLRYDRSALREVVADWLAVHAGPAARLGLGDVTVEPALSVRGSLASRRTGTAVFRGFDVPDEGSTGFAGAVTGQLLVYATGGTMLSIRAGVEKLWAGFEPRYRMADVRLLLPAGAWTVVLRGGLRDIAEDDASDDLAFIGFTLRFSPGSEGARTF